MFVLKFKQLTIPETLQVENWISIYVLLDWHSNEEIRKLKSFSGGVRADWKKNSSKYDRVCYSSYSRFEPALGMAFSHFKDILILMVMAILQVPGDNGILRKEISPNEILILIEIMMLWTQ